MAYQAYNAGPSRADSVLISKKDPRIDTELAELLLTATPTASAELYEKRMYPFIRKAAEEAGADVCVTDAVGNMIVKIGEEGKDHNIVFSAHMDTVQKHADETYCLSMIGERTAEGKFNKVDDRGIIFNNTVDPETGDGKAAAVLGGDDKVGMWILFHLMRAKTPGLYLFHVGEECGGVGSAHIASSSPQMFKHINQAVAFDRMGYTDIITEQSPGVCASTEYAGELADALNKNMPAQSQFVKDQHGTFTDTANFRHLVPECVNISCGYFKQHTTNEHVDVTWLQELFMPAVLKVDWANLPIVRSPSYDDLNKRHTGWGKSRSYRSNRNESLAKGPCMELSTIEMDGEVYDIWTTTPDEEILDTDTDENLPKWTPADGIFTDVSQDTMRRIITKYFATTKYSDIVNAIHKLVIMNSEMTLRITSSAWQLQVAERSMCINDICSSVAAYDGPSQDIKDLKPYFSKAFENHRKIMADVIPKKEITKSQLEQLDKTLSYLVMSLLIRDGQKNKKLAKHLRNGVECIKKNTPIVKAKG